MPSSWSVNLAVYRSAVIFVVAPILLCPILIFLGYPESDGSGARNNKTLESSGRSNLTSPESAGTTSNSSSSKSSNSSSEDASVSLVGLPARCLYVVLVMAVYWMAEVLPLAVTALLPIVLFPVLGILPSDAVCRNYLTDTNFLFVGGLIFAVAVEKSGLHRRVALKVLTIVGSKVPWIMLGFMSATAFLSMWISNTATTAMMLPIAIQVIAELFQDHPQLERSRSEPAPSIPNTEELNEKNQLIRDTNTSDSTNDSAEPPDAAVVSPTSELNFDSMTPVNRRVSKGLVIAICFAANVGGTGTVTGTPPNLVTVGLLNDQLYKNKNTGISFASWMAFAIVPMVITLIFTWLTMVIYYCRPTITSLTNAWKRRNATSRADDPVYGLIMDKYNTLPRWSFAEVQVLVCFFLLLAMWIFREPRTFPGFGPLFDRENPKGESIRYYTDATSTILIAIILFFLPTQLPRRYGANDDASLVRSERSAIIDWPTMQAKFPWSVVLLLGGGLALASGVKESKLSIWLGGQLKHLQSLHLVAIQVICALLTMIVTNITSNTVTASILVPIVNRLALELALNPLALIIPVTLSCSMAFILPVGTPPNAIVFASGLLTVVDMVSIGCIVSVVCLILLVLMTNSYIAFILSLSTFPEWAFDSLPSHHKLAMAAAFNTSASAV